MKVRRRTRRANSRLGWPGFYFPAVFWFLPCLPFMPPTLPAALFYHDVPLIMTFRPFRVRVAG